MSRKQKIREKFLKTGIPIRFHKPHPDKVIKTYLMKQIKTVLEKEGLL